MSSSSREEADNTTTANKDHLPFAGIISIGKGHGPYTRAPPWAFNGWPVDRMASLAEQDSTPASGNANDANVKHNDVPEKVKVNLQATGRAQILKRNKFKLAKDDKFLKLQMFLRAQLKLEQSEALFLFINSSFVPRADETLGNLYENFNVGGELIVNYSREIRWG